jgi:hypothetical protein
MAFIILRLFICRWYYSLVFLGCIWCSCFTSLSYSSG